MSIFFSILSCKCVDKAELMPTPKALALRGEKWGPYRTYASLYLWRIADSAAGLISMRHVLRGPSYVTASACAGFSGRSMRAPR